MTPVSEVLNATTNPAPSQTSLVALNQWIFELRAMPYSYSNTWKTPDEVNSDKKGDCKGKAVALYEKLWANGARDVRLVIGKHHVRDRRTHAWVEWDTAQGTFLLDPTLNWMATVAERQDQSTYIPLYAFESGHKYRAFNPALMTRQDSWSHRVASRE
jgi:predicted transglutaminase-like cysteine proteinase